MKVLVTGVAGFLGTHVAEYYREKGWEVIGIDNLTSYELQRADYDVKKVRKHNLDFLREIGVDFKELDVRFVVPEDFPDIDFIIHCSAQPAMTVAIEHPKIDHSNNVTGIVNMLEVARRYKIPFVNCSSIHVYGNNLNGKLKEEETRFSCDPISIDESHKILDGDLTPLHVSKRATELYTQ